MSRRGERPKKPARYALGFTGTALVLGAMTLIMVLVVLPRRYVLHAGLRESGVSFPAAAAPFAPPSDEPQAPVVLPSPEVVPRPGPAQLFWDEILTLLETGRYAQALPAFERYLREFPQDRSVLREYAITLDRAGRGDQAAAIYEQVLAQGDEPDLRLLFARSLRDRGRVEEAERQYRLLRDASPGDVALALESARALAWRERYDAAEVVLRTSIEQNPEEPSLSVELARIFYWSGRLDDALGILGALDDDDLNRLAAAELRDDVQTALTPPDEPEIEPVPLTLAERAERAMAEGDHELASDLYRQLLEADPDDSTVLAAYADLLQLQLEDIEGAREVLLRLERLGADPALRFRIARLDVWTERNDDATYRLERLLRDVDSGVVTTDETFADRDVTEARALLGDLYRWAGHRGLSGEEYQRALDTDPDSESAQRGMAELVAQMDQDIEDAERPRFGSDVYSFGDSDDFTRLDLAVEGVHIDGSWVVGSRAGSRLVEGIGLAGASGSERGIFAEVRLGRWWKYGTVRTGAHFGVERIRTDGTDVSFGATMHWTSLGSFRTDLRYDHGPAYPLASTFASLATRVVQDRVTLTAARQLPNRWSVALAADAARLDFSDSAEPGGDDTSSRLEASVSLGKAVSDELVLGLSTRALTYTSGSPVVDGLRLFWDPDAVVSAGLYAQWNQTLGERWTVTGRVSPAVAWIDERLLDGFQRVPHFSAEAGVARLGERFRTSVDLFYYQGRFDGYRAYGARIGISVTNPFDRGGAR